MLEKYEEEIANQERIIEHLGSALNDAQITISTKEQQINTLIKKISIYEAANKKLLEEGIRLAETCENLENICDHQQEILENFTKRGYL